MPITPFMNSDPERNARYAQHENDYPCAICGRPTDSNTARYFVAICDNGSHEEGDAHGPRFLTPDEEEAHRNHGGYLGSYPVGAGCVGKYKKDLKPFLIDTKKRPA